MPAKPSHDARAAKVSVRAYIEKLPTKSRRLMKQVAAIIRAAAPTAVDSFGYRIPGFRLDGRVLIYYAAWKDFVSVYPVSRDFERANAAALKGFYTSHKGTLRFPLDKPLPVALVKRLVKDRIARIRS